MKEQARRAATLFGLPESVPLVPLSSDVPVYRLERNDSDWVLKRTGYPRSSGYAIAAWLRTLTERGVDVVAPVDSLSENPRKLPDDDWPGEWVVYPYVDGAPYGGTEAQIRAAGRLLGRLHEEGSDLGRDMLTVSSLPFRERGWIDTHSARAVSALQRFKPAAATPWRRSVSARIAAHEQSRPGLASRNLPLVAASWDYKASNLIYASSNRPILVDPDHAGRIPRMYDLACALILFHNDLSTAPSRVFSAFERRIFLDEYTSQVRIDAEEREAWPDIKLAAWVDQALWLIGNWPEGWQDPSEHAFLSSITEMKLDDFPLT